MRHAGSIRKGHRMLRTRDETGSTRSIRRGTSRRTRIVLTAASAIVLAVSLARWALSIAQAVHSIAGRYDFSTYYAAAFALRHDLHANIYDPTVLARAGAASHVLVNPPLPFTYPPLFAIVLSPFTLLSFRALSRLWLIGNAALWLAIACVLAVEVRTLLGRRLASATDSIGSADDGTNAPSSRWMSLLDDPAPLMALAASAWLCLSFTPASQTLSTGQINILVLAPLALIPWLTRHGHERWVGVMVAIAAMLKFTPALLIVYLLLRRRWEAALAAVIALVALTILSVAVVGPGVLFASLPQALRVGGGDASLGHNQALFAPVLTALRVHGSTALGVATAASRVALVVVAAALAHIIYHLPLRKGAEGVDHGELAAYAVALCAMVLLSPTAWVHHYIWLLPAAAIALGLTGAHLLERLRERMVRPAGLFVAVVVACWGLGAALPYAWDTDPHPAATHYLGLPLWPLALEMRPLAALLLVLALWLGLRHTPARQTAARQSAGVTLGDSEGYEKA